MATLEEPTAMSSKPTGPRDLALRIRRETKDRVDASKGMACVLSMLILVFSASCSAAPGVQAPSTPTETATVMPSSAQPIGELYLPTYPAMDIGPLARISGRLTESGGCLWIENDGDRALALWPSGSTIERDGESLTVVNTAGVRAVVGTDVMAGGGEYGPSQYEFVTELIGEQVPDACRGDDSYVLVYDVRTTGE